MSEDIIDLDAKTLLRTPDGTVYAIRPGPRGKGVALTVQSVPSGGARTRRPGAGRPPKPETLELRRRLEADAAAGRLKPASAYAQWYADKTGVQERSATQTVYRERRRVLAEHPDAAPKRARSARSKGGGARGRKPSKALEALRTKLLKDQGAGRLGDPKDYIRHVMDKDKDIGLKQARSMVYREHRAVRQQ